MTTTPPPARPTPPEPPTPTGRSGQSGTGPAGPAGLAARAVACYRATPPQVGAGQQGWRARAARAVRTLAATLGVDPAHVLAAPDPDRVYGLLATPEVRLTVTEPGTGSGRVFEFVPEYGTSDPFVLLAACPGCARLVPAYRVTTLADLGQHLTRPGVPDAEQFTSDPAHTPGCPRYRPDPRYATAHHTPPTAAPATPPATAAGPGRTGGGPCGCACASGGWCGGCGHAGCSRR